MKIKKQLLSILIIMVGILLMSLSRMPQQGKWQAPKSADTLRNPFKYNIAAAANGKTIYKRMCATCHGDEGKGDGIAGISLHPRPADHTSAKIQALSDGVLYWIITYGNSPMPTYKAVLKDDQRWQLVNYIRELGKNSKN